MDCRRPVLGRITFAADSGLHLGLWLDRGLSAQPDDRGQNREPLQRATDTLFGQLETANCKPQGYGLHLQRVLAAAEELAKDGKARQGEAKVLGRMIVGLGAKNALEFGIHLDHTWGVPVIPGSSLKGLAAATAHKLVRQDAWRKGNSDPNKGDLRDPGDNFQWLFGTTENRGAVQFWDAWWVPNSKKDTEPVPIHRDVMTVHHAKYYQGESDGKGGIVPPSDMDDPNPIGFLSVSGTYLIVVEGDPEWTGAAMALLEKGLIDLGIGAKTNAGYGRLNLEYQREAAASAGAQQAATSSPAAQQQAKPTQAGPSPEARAELAQAALAKFKSEVGKANEAGRPTAILANWGALAELQQEAAVWTIEHVYGVDSATAEKKYAKRDWYKVMRSAYMAAKR